MATPNGKLIISSSQEFAFLKRFCRHIYRIEVGKLEEKRPLLRPRHKYEVNFKMGLKEIGYKGV
jgi:hypothetical protein